MAAKHQRAGTKPTRGPELKSYLICSSDKTKKTPIRMVDIGNFCFSILIKTETPNGAHTVGLLKAVSGENDSDLTLDVLRSFLALKH